MTSLMQDPRLNMRVLGIKGDDGVPDGVHLRWSFAPELGFPPEGFRLWVRDSESPELSVANVGAAAAALPGPPPGLVTGDVTVHNSDGLPLDTGIHCDRPGLTLSARPLVVRFRPGFSDPPGTVREVWLSVVTDGGRVSARALHAGRVAACADLAELDPAPEPCTVVDLVLRADAIDAVEVTGEAAALLVVAYASLADDECERGWEPVTDRICLPVSPSAAYPCPDADPYEVAKSRLPDPATLPPGAPAYDELERRLLGDSFEELRAMLEQMLDRAPDEPAHLQRERLDPDDPKTPATFQLQPLHQVLLGGTDPYFARIVGLYHLDQRFDGAWDYKVEASWPDAELDLCWIAFGVTTEPRPPLEPPTDVTATAFPGTSAAPDGAVQRYQADVGVGWRRPSACDLSDPRLAAVAWLVERTAANAPETGPYEPLSQREFDDGVQEAPLLLTEAHDPAAPYPLGHYIDRAPGYGTFHYRIRARDLFGRTSEPSEPAGVLVRDLVPPGCPINLAADHIDPADPDRAGSPALAWANRDTPAGAPPRAATQVGWVWPVGRQRQAPDADEFRLYYRAGPRNTVAGSVRAVNHLGGGVFRVDTDLPAVAPNFPTTPAPVDIGVLSNEGEEYPIRTASATAAGMSFTVTGPPAAPPLPGRCAFRFGAGEPAAGTPARPPHPAWRSYREPADWAGLVLDPAQPGVPAPLRIGLDGSVRSPLPAGLTPADVEVSRTAEAAPEGGNHLHYAVRLRGVVLATTRQRPRAQGSFGVTAADDAAPPNESRVSPPAGIFAVHREPPQVPDLSLPDELYATPADWFGHSYFTLTFTAVRGTGYLVYRASDAKVLEAAGVSLADHRALPAAQQRQQLRELGSRQVTVAAFGPVTPEPLWPGADGPVSHRDRLDGSVRNRFVYRLRAIDRAGNLAPWPADPVPAEAGRVAVVVAVPVTTPPSPPRWAGTQPTDAGPALHWVPNPEPDLAGYRLYRADTLDAAGDPRGMTPLLNGATPEGAGGLVPVRVRRGSGPTPTIEVEQLPPGETPTDRLVRFVDTTVDGGRTVYYRLVAEDERGNRSLPSDPLAVRPPKRQPPGPPTWVAADRTPGGIDLAWTAGEPDLEPLVLRRRPDDPLWQPVSAWLPRGTTSHVDAGAAPDTGYEYRIRVRDRVGHVVDGPVQAVG